MLASVRNDLVDVVFVVSQIRQDFPTVQTLLSNFNSTRGYFNSLFLRVPNQINKVVDLLRSVSDCKLLFLPIRLDPSLLLQQPIELPLLVDVQLLILDLLSSKHLLPDLPNLKLNLVFLCRLVVEHILHFSCVEVLPLKLLHNFSCPELVRGLIICFSTTPN